MDNDGCFKALAGLFLVGAALFIVFLVVVYVLPPIVSVGGIYGGGIALVNYSRSLIKNVRPEGDPEGILAKVIIVLLAGGLAGGLCYLLFECEGTRDFYSWLIRFYHLN